MGFRDDREALRARIDALQRENEQLAAAVEGSSDRDEVAARLARIEVENRALREQLERLRGPSLRERAGDLLWRIVARPAPPPTTPGFGEAALRCWRLYAPFIAGLLAWAAVRQDGLGLATLGAFVVLGPVLAALLLGLAWLTGKRSPGAGGAMAALGLALAGYGLFVALSVWTALYQEDGPSTFTAPVAAYVTFFGLAVLRVFPLNRGTAFILPWLVMFAMPGPQYLVGLMLVALLAMCGQRLGDPSVPW